jgi:HD-GYP domain-containing protein (c-di-GMP phosphodiesterase class II)
MVIRGIWGQVLLKEQSLIVNDPVSYPDRVGIPEGHPPLTSFLGVPLKDQNKVIGMIAMANCGSGYTADHQQDMEALSVAFVEAIRRKQGEVELQRTLKSLRKAVGATIQVMVSAVEVRDPYTAGHQIRSADLARNIAKEMGLPQEKIDGIRMAGSIHDIGKLSIPAEILSKPTRLTEIEFSLIKEHSRSGYEILKDVESPWPLAEIVYQHHERMDGSGYPRNLKGDDILMEARIMAVADVVESMASHRPYRAGLGIDAALEEISKNRDILYDPKVSDACLRLFQEKGYRFN